MLRALFHQAAEATDGEPVLRSYDRVVSFLESLSTYGYISSGDKNHLKLKFKELTPPFTYDFVKLVLSWVFSADRQDSVQKSLNYSQEMSSRALSQQLSYESLRNPSQQLLAIDTSQDRSIRYDWTKISDKVLEEIKTTDLYLDPTTMLSQGIDLCESEQGIQDYLSSLILSSDSYLQEDPLISQFLSGFKSSLQNNQTQFGMQARNAGIVDEPGSDNRQTNVTDESVVNLFWKKLRNNASLEVCHFIYSLFSYI